MPRFKIICTHNPQDFFNGEEPYELAKVYQIDDLEAAAARELADGYQVVVAEAGDDNA